MVAMSPLTKRRFVAYLAGIFIAGMVSGGLLVSWLGRQQDARRHDPQNLARHMEKRFQTELKLSEDQVAKLRPIIVRDAEAIQAFNLETMQKIEQFLDRSRREFIQALNPEQLERFQKMESDRKAFFEKRMKNRPPSNTSSNSTKSKEVIR
jgi:hypothetical protein